MKTRNKNRGFTLMEACMVVALLVGMLGLATWGFSAWANYQQGLRIEAGLNVLAAAQVRYLRTNPTQNYAGLTTNALAPYLPFGQMPQFPSGSTVSVTVSPPTATYGGTTWVAKQF